MIGVAREARALAVGSSLGRITHPAPTRMEIAWYMVASYDRNPIHVDEPFAQAAGFPTVIGQGMIPLGYVASRLVGEVGHSRLRGLGAEFIGPVFPGEDLVTEIVLVGEKDHGEGVELSWKIAAENSKGEAKLRGWARTFHEDDGGKPR